MKKILSLTLSALLLIALLAGCGGAAEQSLAGSWTADVNMTDYLNDMLGEEEELGQYLTLDDFTIKLLAEFKDDGTYTFSGDPEAAKAAMDNLKVQLKGAMTAYLEDMIEQEDLGMSLDELLEASGMSLDDLVNEMDESFSAEDLVSGLSMEGKYKYEEGKLYLSDSLDEEAEEYEAAQLEGDTLTLTGEGEEDGEFEGLYPVVFQRAG